MMKSPRSFLQKSNAGSHNAELSRLVAKNFSVDHLHIGQFSLGETFLHTYTRTDRERERALLSERWSDIATPHFFLFISAVIL